MSRLGDFGGGDRVAGEAVVFGGGGAGHLGDDLPERLLGLEAADAAAQPMVVSEG